MILVDANILLYAYAPSSEFHDRARAWLEKVLSQSDPVRFAWVTLLAFARISTNPRAVAEPLTTAQALTYVSDWLARPMAGILDPGERHLEILKEVSKGAQASGATIMDAHLAALAIEHGAILHTADRGFARFSELQIVNPLEALPVAER